MSTLDVLYRLADRRILLELDGDRIRWTGPAGAMTPDLADLIRDHRTALIEALTPPPPSESTEPPPCRECRGRGHNPGAACPECNGTGRHHRRRDYVRTVDQMGEEVARWYFAGGARAVGAPWATEPTMLEEVAA